MTQLTTQGINVQVETFYSPEYSNVLKSEYVFAYRITLENLSNQTVKLLSRHWIINDSNGIEREVKGEGVVGEQPILEPNETYSYMSSVNFITEMGTMRGTYTMRSMENMKEFMIFIPQFYMEVPFKAN